MLVRFTFPRRSCLVPHSSQLLYLLFSLPRNVCSFSEVWIKCSLFSKVSSRSSPLVREGGLDFSLICDPRKKKKYIYIYISVQFSSVAQSCPTLCDPMDHSTPGLSVYYQLPEFTQTHVHRVSDAIQPSHPLSSPSPPAQNPSQYQSLF